MKKIQSFIFNNRVFTLGTDGSVRTLDSNFNQTETGLYANSITKFKNFIITAKGNKLIFFDVYTNNIDLTKVLNNDAYFISNEIYIKESVEVLNELYKYDIFSANETLITTFKSSPMSSLIEYEPTHRRLFHSFSNTKFIKCIDLTKGEICWKIDFSNLKNQFDKWHFQDEPITIYGSVKQYKESIIISIGTPFEQRLACFSTLNGSLLWLSKEYNSTGVFHIKDDFVYSVYNNKVIRVNCITGEASMIDISEQSTKTGITMSHNFSLNENYIIGADFRNLKLAVLNIDTWQFDFFHQFVKGKDINKSVWQIGVPQYYKGSVYVLDSDDTLHILPFKV